MKITPAAALDLAPEASFSPDDESVKLESGSTAGTIPKAALPPRSNLISTALNNSAALALAAPNIPPRSAPKSSSFSATLLFNSEGKYHISGAGLRAPPQSVVQKSIDTVLEAITLGAVKTQTFDALSNRNHWARLGGELALQYLERKSESLAGLSNPVAEQLIRSGAWLSDSQVNDAIAAAIQKANPNLSSEMLADAIFDVQDTFGNALFALRYDQQIKGRGSAESKAVYRAASAIINDKNHANRDALLWFMTGRRYGQMYTIGEDGAFLKQSKSHQKDYLAAVAQAFFSTPEANRKYLRRFLKSDDYQKLSTQYRSRALLAFTQWAELPEAKFGEHPDESMAVFVSWVKSPDLLKQKDTKHWSRRYLQLRAHTRHKMGKFQGYLDLMFESEIFRNAKFAKKFEMIEAMGDASKRFYFQTAKPLRVSWRLARRAGSDHYTISEPIKVATHAFYDAPTQPALRYDVRFKEGVVPVFVPTAWAKESDGLAYELDELANLLAEMPPILRREAAELVMSPGDYAAASANNEGHVTFYSVRGRLRRLKKSWVLASGGGTAVMAHELGHVVTLRGEPIGGLSFEEAWIEAIARDLAPVSRYGSTNVLEDMAETSRMYFLSKGSRHERKFRKQWPNRFALLDEIYADLERKNATTEAK